MTSIREEKRAKFEAKGKGSGRRPGWVAGIVVIALLAAGLLGYRVFFRPHEEIAGNDPVKSASPAGGFASIEKPLMRRYLSFISNTESGFTELTYELHDEIHLSGPFVGAGVGFRAVLTPWLELKSCQWCT